MGSSEKPRGQAKASYPIDHVLVGILVVQFVWFAAQKAGWFQNLFPRGVTELFAFSFFATLSLLAALFFCVRWLFVHVELGPRYSPSQFSIRTTLLYVPIASFVLAQFAMSYHASQNQYAASKRLAFAGGAVVDSSGAPGNFRPPAWLASLVTPKFFYDIQSASAINDSQLAYVSQLTDAQELYLDGRVVSNTTTPVVQFPTMRSQITDAGLAHLRDLPRVKSIELNSSKVTSVGADHLSQLRNLETLVLTSTQVDDAGLERLSRLTNLKSLAINGRHADDAKVWRRLRILGNPDHQRAIEEFGARKIFWYETLTMEWPTYRAEIGLDNWSLPRPQSNITDKGLSHLARLSKLQSLDLQDSNVTGEALRYFQQHKNLTRLSLRGTKTSDEGLRQVATLHVLESLSLDETPISDAGLVHLQSLSQLERLSLYDTTIDGTGFSRWQNTVPLLQLDLGRTQIDDTTIKHLSVFSKLEQLDLDGTNVTDAGLASLAQLGCLQELSLAGTKITGEGLRHLQSCKSLRKLDLGECPLEDDHLVHLCKFPALQSLNLSFTSIAKASLSHLQRCPPLREVKLLGNKLTWQDVRSFHEERGDCRFTY